MRDSKPATRCMAILASALLILVSGCASASLLPANASLVNFDGPEGKTGWSKYEQTETFEGYTVEQVFSAAKVGLGTVGFALRRADRNAGIVVGEHGMTAHDWNVVAGVYLKPVGDAVAVKVIVEGSKDIGFSGDVTSDGWAGKIIGGIRTYLNDTHQAVLKVDRADLKK